jgi:TATA-box binding protein (TBP) (component of TFIID and TFIIIB)
MVLQNLSNYIYELEIFPGIIYRSVNRPTALIFHSGKLVISQWYHDNCLSAAKLSVGLVNVSKSGIAIYNSHFLSTIYPSLLMA